MLISLTAPISFGTGRFAPGETIGAVQWLACLLITLAILMTPARATRNLATQLAMSRVMPRKPQ